MVSTQGIESLVCQGLEYEFSANRTAGADGSIKMWLHDEQQAYKISRLRFRTLKLLEDAPYEWKMAQHQGFSRLVARLSPRWVWLHLRVMRLVEEQPDCYAGGTLETCFPYLVGDDNHGLEDLVVDCTFMLLVHLCLQIRSRWLTRIVTQACRSSILTNYLEPC